jgi:hypothetical protein
MPQQLKILLFFIGFMSCQGIGHAWQLPGPDDTILLGGLVVNQDTFPIVYLHEVEVTDYMDPQRRADMARLRYNVYKVYPYAITAAYVLNRVDQEMAIRTKRKDRKRFLKEEEKELKERFKGELKNLTITQGKILVKLINRETGRDCYDVIKQLKGGLNARIYQTTAFFFDNNLKEQYDPYGEDKDIEKIVREIESKSYIQHQKLSLPKDLTP